MLLDWLIVFRQNRRRRQLRPLMAAKNRQTQARKDRVIKVGLKAKRDEKKKSSPRKITMNVSTIMTCPTGYS